MNWEPWTGCYKISEGCSQCYFYGPHAKRYGQNTIEKTDNFQVDDVLLMAQKAERLGALRAGEQFGGNDFITMIDPAGHPFCLCRK